MIKLKLTETNQDWVLVEEYKKQVQGSVFASFFPDSELENISAVVYNNEHYTYGYISDIGLRLSSYLLDCMANKDGSFKSRVFDDVYRVALCLPQGPGAIALLNACLACGIVTVFIDLDQQIVKSRQIFNDFQADLVFGPSTFKSQTDKHISVQHKYIDIEFDEDIIGLAGTFSKVDRFPPFDRYRPAIIIYTSGSTGIPKGVVLSHLNIFAHIERFISVKENYFLSLVNLGSWQSSTISGIFRCARSRGRFYIVNKKQSRFPVTVAKFLIDNNIAAISGPVSYIKLLFDSQLLNAVRSPHLKYVRLWGERIESSLISSILGQIPRASIRTWYDSSEAMISSISQHTSSERTIASDGECMFQMNPLVDFEFEKDSTNTDYARLKVTGSNVMMGYWNQIRNSIIPGPNASMSSYLFEDWVEPISNNCFKVVGRIDSMVKILGQKVSLAEIESIIQSHEDVEQVCAFMKVDQRDIARIHAAIVPKIKDISKTSIITHCRKRLIVEAIPFNIELYSSFPRLSSGKLDRKCIAAKFRALDHST